jgi:hypothetical protein
MTGVKYYAKVGSVLGALTTTAILWLILLRNFGALPAVRHNTSLLETQGTTLHHLQAEVDSLKWEVRKHQWSDRKEN